MLSQTSCGFPLKSKSFEDYNHGNENWKKNEIRNKFHLPFFWHLQRIASTPWGVKPSRQSRWETPTCNSKATLCPFSEIPFLTLSHEWQVEEIRAQVVASFQEKRLWRCLALLWPFNHFLPCLIFITLTRNIKLENLLQWELSKRICGWIYELKQLVKLRKFN